MRDAGCEFVEQGLRSQPPRCIGVLNRDLRSNGSSQMLCRPVQDPLLEGIDLPARLGFTMGELHRVS